MTTTQQQQQSPYQTLLDTLLQIPHVPLSLPTSPHPLLISQKPTSQTATIASLSLHPTLESALHILNLDLPSAHFLLRHAQSKPALEMMYLHGVLHRVEGDIENARAWYGNVEDAEADVMREVWGVEKDGDLEGGWREFLDEVEGFKGRRKGGKGVKVDDEDYVRLRDRSLREIVGIIRFCERKFGTEAVVDASEVWVKDDPRLKEKSQGMIVGGEGWREF